MLAATFHILLVALFPLAMACAAISDLTTMTISNRLAIVLVAGFLALVPATGMGWQELALHGAAGALVLVVTFGFFVSDFTPDPVFYLRQDPRIPSS